MLIIFLLIAPSTCQFASYLSLRLRLPGRCKEGDFDCGFGSCVPVRKFHDGRPDCPDSSDEWCVGQFRCGAYCVDFKDSIGCLFNSKCDGSSRQPKFCDSSKEKFCSDPQAFPCKGYGECVPWSALMDRQKDCIDGSDEDVEYVRTLEGPFRCYFNKTQQPQPSVVINYVLPPPPPVATPSPPLVPAIPVPLCNRCPPPYVFPNMPVFQSTAKSSFPTLIPSIPLPVTLPSPVQIQHITPVPAIQSEPGYGDLFPETFTPAPPPPFPSEVDYTVQAHIKTVLPATTVLTSPSSLTTTMVTLVTTDDFAHIKVNQESGSEKTDNAAHIDLNIGQVIYNSVTTTISTVETTTSFTQSPVKPSIISIEGNFFPIKPIDGKPPVAIRPLPHYTYRPIIPQTTVDYNNGEHLIPIQPGIAVPSPHPDGSTTPKYPFPEDYDEKMDGNTAPTVKIGVVGGSTTEGITIYTTTALVNLENTTYARSTTSTPTTVEPEESTTTVFETTTTEEIETSTVNPVAVEHHKNTICPDSLLLTLKQKYSTPFCQCDKDHGCSHLNDTIFRVEPSTVCDAESSANDEDKARVVLSAMNRLPFSTCISSNSDGIIVSMNCSNCTLQGIKSSLERLQGTPIHIQMDALNSSLCDVDNINNCHQYALCIVEPSGLRYHCLCKEGTEDISQGRGLNCFGFPAEDDCIMIFGICLIVWLLFLFGFLFCCPLVAFMCYRHNRKNVVQPITSRSKTTNKASTKNGIHKSSSASSKSAMASILVDALRNNAKGISAVSQSISTRDRVRFTDEVFYPPNTDWRPLPDSSIEPQSIMKNTGITSTSSEPRLSAIDGGNPPIQSVAGTPISVAETPILDHIRTPHDSARGNSAGEKSSVRSLPIPTIEVPMIHKTSLDERQFPSQSRIPLVVTADVHQENQMKDDNHSVVSVGIQPTIWETYRAVGVIGVDTEREDSSSSLDDLIGKKFPESKPKAKETLEVPIPRLDLVPSAPPSQEEIAVPLPEEALVEIKNEPPADFSTPVSSQAQQKKSVNKKLADMLGVTIESEIEGIHDRNDFQALNDMAENKIDLPLEHKSVEKLEDNLMSLESERQKTPDIRTAEISALKDLVAEELKVMEKKQEPKEDLKSIIPPQKTIEEKGTVFVPRSTRRGRSHLGPLLSIPKRGESSTEESDPEVAFFKRMETMRRPGRETNPFKDRKRRYKRPERQLSSISEKSAEISNEAAIKEHEDYTVSAPNTTRSLSDWHAYIHKNKRFNCSNTEDTDIDIPAGLRRKPLVESPEIPDVSLRRSRERLDSLQDSTRSKAPANDNRSIKHLSRSSSKSFLPEISKRPTISRSSMDSRNRASVVSRKIASRKTEMRSSKSASDLTFEQQELKTRPELVTRRDKIARSEEFLARRPPWDISPYREGDEKERKLPQINTKSSYLMRSSYVSPVCTKKRTTSHGSLTARSGSSVSLSPYFDPREPNKPPKEELWWTPSD